MTNKICPHKKHIIAEREFSFNQVNKFKWTRLICKKCGASKFIPDKV
jgi:hypothetical protein